MAVLLPHADRDGHTCVVGGANVDIEGRATGRLEPRDSSPGTVGRTPGGVGRNVAENLARLGVPAHLVTVVGDDLNGRWLTQLSQDAGVDTSSVITVPGAATATYLSVLNAAGEMTVAINDMAILERLQPETLQRSQELLSTATAVVCDTNLAPATLSWLCELLARARVPLLVDTVSAAKAARLAPNLARVHLIKPNALEAEVLTGIRVTDRASAESAADALVQAGVANVVVTLGATGAVYVCDDDKGYVPAHPVEATSVTGAGDAMTAGLVYAGRNGASLEEAVRYGMAAAALATESASTVAATMSADALNARVIPG